MRARLIVSALMTFALIYLLDMKIGTVPPVGGFLSPFDGFWRNAVSLDLERKTEIDLKSTCDDVTIEYDLNDVPHIFAGNNHDLYFTQGYITAKDRLWQMELQARKASGTLAEVYGNRVIKADMHYRRIGLLYAAEKGLDSAFRDPDTKTMLQAYSDGVNAYIKSLTPASYPIEYKLLGRKPMLWQPIYSVLTLKLIAEQLTGGEPEFIINNGLIKLGLDTLRDLLGQSLTKYPVIPRHTPWNFKPVSIPAAPREYGNNTKNDVTADLKNDGSVIGSNNWVVSGKKTLSGYPILANDPHLALTLPSIWFEVQMKAPGVNVYGVSVPGIPCVLVGYNEHVAWGITNTMADVLDWYKIKFRDSTMGEYQYNNQWEKIQKHIERFKTAEGKVLFDTVLYTHYGPVIYGGTLHRNPVYIGSISSTEGFAMQWVLHYPSNDIKAFYLLNRAHNYEDYRQALAYVACPALNIAFASNDNDISIVCSGRFPIRYRHQGEYLLNGSIAADDWHGWIPASETPSARNPGSGYLCSANQQLTDSAYPYFIGGIYASDARAERINTRLSSVGKIDADSFRLLQMDSYSELAERILPFLLRHLKSSETSLDRRIVNQISKWNYIYSRNSIGATIFNEWWNELYSAIWEGNIGKYNARLPWPDYDRTVILLKSDSGSHWLASGRPPGSSISGLVTDAFLKAINILIRKNGNFGESWCWGNSRVCSISHISGIPSFGIKNFSADGAPNTINALAGQAGPSWRMVVELGPDMKGYGIMPGGQSGNPGSIFYDNQFPSWRDGKLKELLFLHSKAQISNQIITVVILKK